MKESRKNAISKMKEDAAAGKIQNHKAQKDFLTSVLADNDDEVDIDPEVADSLVESQKSYAKELKAKFKRRKAGTANASDDDFEAPSKEELDEMMQQTLKLRKQRKLAKQAAEDEAAFNCGTNCTANATNATNGTAKVGLTADERAAKTAEREAARAAKKEEMEMMRDLQAVQSSALLDEMKNSNKSTIVSEQSYGDTYMKTAVLSADKLDEQMYTGSDGEQKMQIGKGADASVAPEDAVNATAPASNTTAPAARRLQDAATTSAGNASNATNATNDWKKLKKEEDYMRVVVNKKMFAKGGPLENVTKPVVIFNKHSADYVSEFPRAKPTEYHANGSKVIPTAEQNATKKAEAEAKAKAAGNATVSEVSEDDYKL